METTIKPREYSSDLLLNTAMLMDSMSAWIEGDNDFYDRAGGQLAYLDTMVEVAQSLEDWVAARPERNDWEDTAGWDTGIEKLTAKLYLFLTMRQLFTELLNIDVWIEWAFDPTTTSPDLPPATLKKPVKICDNCLCKDQPIGLIVEVVDESADTCEWPYCTEKEDQ